jgi:hypothetical protein
MTGSFIAVSNCIYKIITGICFRILLSIHNGFKKIKQS